MKRIFGYMLVGVMLLSVVACGAQEQSTSTQNGSPSLNMAEVAESNTVKNLLKRYQTVTYSQSDHLGKNSMRQTYSKDAEGAIFCMEDYFEYSGYHTDDFVFGQEEDVLYYELLAMQEHNYASGYQFVLENGVFTTQTTDKNGHVVCTAESEIDQVYADALSSWEVSTDDKMISITVFAPDDWRVLSIEFSIQHQDGSYTQIASSTLEYDQIIVNNKAAQLYQDSEKWCATVFFADGTSRAYELPKGAQFTYFCDEGYALYQGAEGGLPYPKETAVPEEALTLYCLPDSSGSVDTATG